MQRIDRVAERLAQRALPDSPKAKFLAITKDTKSAACKRQPGP
jgi:hypothetical protein